MHAHSGEGADGGQRCGPPITRRALIGGVVGAAGLLTVGASMQDGAMASEHPMGPRAAGLPPFRADAPQVYTRAQWNARSPKRAAEILDRPPDHIVVHHTASANSRDRSLGHAFDLSRQIQKWHMDGNGWNDSGQQLTISRGGIVMEGRNQSLAAIRARNLAVGAHVLHHNQHTIGIENEGTYTGAKVPRRLWNSLVEVCAWLCLAYNLEPAEAIVGHRDYNSTSCPGDVLYARLPELRRSVADRLNGSGGAKGSASGLVTSILPSFGGMG
ncbi:peptidoglycan recognition family protein [Actinomadura livida]|uniref:Peptidoglycan recognition family protein n=1 Tax=Actinomadura livida TaxID=79909 RepID=A0ABN1DUX4_9ACTN|nr:hypothetical protein GCM10010208_59670 [Actinomadura livida]